MQTGRIQGTMSTIPHVNYEEQLRQNGFTAIAGVDEVGRGAWAGPIVACAVIMPLTPRLRGVRDSKALSPARRELLAERIQECAVGVGIGIISREQIDEVGIGVANALAMQEAIEQLQNVDYILTDGKPQKHLPLPHTAVVKGDTLIYSVAAASIIAKVTRDQMMREYAQEFPHYAFEINKGYGTVEHRAALEQHGMCVQHRRSFHPMSSMLE